MLAATTSDPLAIVAVIVGSALALIGALALIILNDIRNRIALLERHQASLLRSYWAIAWRADMMEEYLERNLEYHPPKRTEPWQDEH